MGQVGPQDRPSGAQDRILRRPGSSCRDDVDKMSSSSRLEVVLRRVKSHKVEFAKPPLAQMGFPTVHAAVREADLGRGRGGRASFPPGKIGTFGTNDDIKSHTSGRPSRDVSLRGPI